jgi:2-(1,2-epoxy-1,2-dihydrophenyl)acetyl-CoA isomerase
MVRAMPSLLVERAAGVVTLTLNRPEKKNAIDPPLFELLLDELRRIKANEDDRCVVLTGAGGEFSSGFDLSGAGSGRNQLVFMRGVGDTVLALHDLPQPTIAKVPGVAAGVGANLALGCDLIVASDEARFSEIFAKRGLSIDGGGSWLLPRLVGLHRAKELAFFAEIISAKEAQDIGLVNRVVPAAELDAFVDDWAQRLAAGPTVALGLTKKLLHLGLNSSLADAVEAEAQANGVTSHTEDVVEALTAFVEKRPATFKGR